MKPSITNTNITPDLSKINTLEQLRAEIMALTISTDARQHDLEDRWVQLPKQAMKTTAALLFPKFLNRKTLGKIYKGLSGLLAISSFIGAARKKHTGGSIKVLLGLVIKKMLLTAAFKLFAKWKAGRKNVVPANRVNPPLQPAPRNF